MGGFDFSIASFFPRIPKVIFIDFYP